MLIATLAPRPITMPTNTIEGESSRLSPSTSPDPASAEPASDALRTAQRGTPVAIGLRVRRRPRAGK
eukprot:4945721-Prymnesium_polylepis.1